jgi:hypothetical protein
MKKLLKLSKLSRLPLISILVGTSVFLSMSLSLPVSAQNVTVYLPSNVQLPPNNANVRFKSLPSNGQVGSVIVPNGNVAIPYGNYYGYGYPYYNNNSNYDVYGNYIPQNNAQAIGYGLGAVAGWK